MSPALPHLARRFFGVLVATPLRPGEQAAVGALLRPAERALFWGQPAADQRHGLECARAVQAACPGRSDLARAALLHDVGKRRSGLGAVGRSLATALAGARLPGRGRFAAYREHGPLGATELEAAGAEPMVVAFARHHHAKRPDAVPAADWEVLRRADHA